jgi:hypothetical protein
MIKLFAFYKELGMCQADKPGFLYHFDNLEDPRIDRKKLYPLNVFKKSRPG